MKVRFKNDDCYFDSDQLDEIRENTKKESKSKSKIKRRYSEDEFFKQQNKKRKLN